MEEKRDRKPVWLPTSLHRELKVQAAKEDLNMGELIAAMLQDRKAQQSVQEFRAA